jgi:hypothetical protein
LNGVVKPDAPKLAPQCLSSSISREKNSAVGGSATIDWCSYDAAKYAVQHWHYSRSLPCSKTARSGVWEDDKFIGAVIFAWGANRHLAGEYNLKMTECVELCRIALDKHTTPVSRIISIAVKMLKREMPGIRLIVSYTDMNQGHVGKIYQASNWLYVGQTGHQAGIMLNGKLTHRRTINSKYGTSDIDWLRKRIDLSTCRYEGKPKFKYLLPLDGEIAECVESLKSHTHLRHKQRERCAWIPSRRERCKSDRGAPTRVYFSFLLFRFTSCPWARL